MNLNELARKVTLAEGKAKSISIAQVKEVMGILLRHLATIPETEAIKMLRAYRKKLSGGPEKAKSGCACTGKK